MLDEKTQECMLSPKGFNKFQSDGDFANCCGKQPTELASEIQKILDELEKHRGAGPDSVQRRPEESVESEDSIVEDSGSNQTASSHVPTENTQSYGKDTNPKKRKRPSAAPSFATNSLSPDDMHKSCDECLISSEQNFFASR